MKFSSSLGIINYLLGYCHVLCQDVLYDDSEHWRRFHISSK